MKKRSKYCFIIFMLHLTCINAQRVGGGNIDTLEERMKIKVNYPLTRGESAVPASNSLRSFAPPVKSQGSIPSCISWATAYAGMTIVKRIEQGNLEMKPFSAMNLYNRVRTYDNLYDCNAGSIFYSNIAIAKSNGVKLDDDYPEYCENLSKTLTYSNKLNAFEDLVVTAWNIKYAIARNRPVMIGMKMYSGEYWGTMSYHETGIWDGTHTGNLEWNHGMLVIGYDDNKAGGAFLVMNSWGTDFGKDGFFWLKYRHVVNEVVCAYAMIPSVDNSRFVKGVTRGESDQSIPSIAAIESTADTLNPVIQSESVLLQNRCGIPVHVALAQAGVSTQFSKGWYSLPTDADQRIPVKAQDSLFLYVLGEGIHLLGNGTKFRINTTQAFEYKSSIFGDAVNFCFVGVKLPNDQAVVLTCENDKQPEFKITLPGTKDTSSLQTRNTHWNGYDILFDILTGTQIKPNDKGIYTVYLISENKSIKKGKFRAKQLASCKGVLKFGDKVSAQQWLKTEDEESFKP